jgi:uncharacterized protein (DUF608 family)
MKRRDFITKTSLTAAFAGSLLTTEESKATPKTKAAGGISDSEAPNISLKDDGPRKEVLKYTDKARSGIMVGSMGAGGAELRKDGVFYNWSIFNNNPKGTGPFLTGKDWFDSNEKYNTMYPIEPGYLLFFIVRYQMEGEEPQLKLLQIDEGYQAASIGMHVYEFPWLTGIEEIEYSARFPFTNLKFSDSEMPFDIELVAHSPFIPHDIKNSSLPIMNFDFKVKSKSSKPVDIMLLGSFRHLVGYDTMDKYYVNEINKTAGYVENIASTGDQDSKMSSFGTLSFASLNPESTYYVGWESRHPYYEYVLRNKTLPNINDTDGIDSILKEHKSVPEWMPETKGRNGVDEKTGKKRGSHRTFNTLAYSKRLNNGESFNHSFVMSWHFPNNYDAKQKVNVGHYYQNFFKDSKEAMAYYFTNKATLSKQSQSFVDNFYASTLPTFVLDQINSQLNTFVTSGVLSKKMEFGVLEGITQHQNWGPVGTTDVNMYGGVMISSLFPDLAKSTMRIHKLLQHEGGEIRHSFEKGFADAMMLAVNATGYVVSERLDLHAQYTVMALRDFFWTDDKAYLTEMWPSIKKAMDYVLRERDLNGDQQPDMTGIMSSYDNFPMYGMATYIQSQWLCALASCVEGAKVMGDTASQQKYKAIFDKGKKLAEEKLWNGKYYRLYNSDLKVYKIKDGAGKEITKDISGLDEGCLTDQIIGQWAARWSGLGDILEPAHVKIAMKSILEKSYRPKFGLRNCSWPVDTFVMDVAKDIWVDQANTCWSGVELAFASFLLYEGMYNEALQVVKTVDDRYRKAGRYFDHQEFGGHYFRSMSAWGIVNAMLGLSVNQEVYSFAPKFPDKNFKMFFSFATGTANVDSNNGKVTINVLSGNMNVKKINLADFNLASTYIKATLGGKKLSSATVAGNKATLDFKKTIIVKAGESLTIA